MAGNIRVRPVAQSDRGDWGHLWKDYCDFYEETVPEEVTETTWQRFFDDRAPLFSLVAEDGDGTIIGFTNFVVVNSTWEINAECYLEDLFVDPKFRGNGAGRSLIDAVVERARREDWQRVYWQTKNNNRTARSLYDKITPVSDWVIYEVHV